jgi:DnaJ family protein A protein 5
MEEFLHLLPPLPLTSRKVANILSFPSSIKRAYKKKALELHPDRNYGNVEEATQLFIGIQAAYEVLSDPQERAWYDSHREQILGGGGDHYDGGATETHPVSVTTSEGVLEWFSLFTTTKLSYDDNARSNFYVVLGEAFKKLADEEIVAAEWANKDAVYFPDFGNSKSTHEDWVKQFYAAWGGFRTQKSFSWCDIYRYQDAPDRRVKRIMEKENKKARDSAIREFNETVRVGLHLPRFLGGLLIRSTV